MFYLSEFFKLLKLNKILMGIFCLSIVGVITTFEQKDSLKKKILENNTSKQLPYFNALVQDSVNIENIQRKMKELPGVISVAVLESKSFKRELQKLQGSFDKEILSELTDINLKKIKIVLEKGLLEKNQNLIREYLSRLAGKDSVTLGGVKAPLLNKKHSESTQVKILKWTDLYLLSLLSLFFLISTVLLQKNVNKHAFIIERFQRRKNVKFKIMMTGATVMSLIAIVINFALAGKISVNIMAPVIVILFMMTLFTLTTKLRFNH
jgi:hypothetical protein